MDDLGLVLAIHFDALRKAPRAYLAAVWWRICGKRLRARSRFSPLLGTSPRAYRLWMQSETGPIAPSDSGPEAPEILALIAAGNDGAALAQTLASAASEGLETRVVGSPDCPSPAAAIAPGHARWLLALQAGDTLAPGTQSAYRAAVSDGAGDALLIYADDDLCDARGQRSSPHFKPGWNPELWRHFDYLTGACLVRAEAADLAGITGPDWPAQLVARAVARSEESGAPVRHVSTILHHRRTRPAPRSVPALAVQAAQLPSLSVIVPTRNRVDLLRMCLEGLARTDYPDFEVIVVDNGSDDPATLAYLDALEGPRHTVLRAPGPFNFSALNNRAADRARGELLCLLNNDIEVLDGDWLAILARQALRRDVGAVGAQLLYPDGRIQHAGVVLGVGGGAAHAHRLLRPEDEGYFRRHALPQFASAVTAACLVVRKDRFEAVGGLDEENFKVAFNDVDLCMKLNERGWQSLYEPRARLIHHESVSRGLDRDPVGAARLAGELAALKARWGTGHEVDPYHHRELSEYSERFVVRL